MKLKHKLILLSALAASFLYTGCYKAHDPVGPTLSAKAVSSLVALNLSQNLYDGYGIFTISSGLNSAPMPRLNRQQKRLNLINLLKLAGLGKHKGCGAVKDTTLKRDTIFADTINASIGGHLRFAFYCTNGAESGFRVTDNLNIQETNARVSSTIKLSEDLTMTSIDPADHYSNLYLTGIISSSSKQQHKTGSKQPGTDSFVFNFKQLTINSFGDIYSGTATFSTSGSSAAGVWDYNGTIQFLDNNQAKITINGSSYNIDIHTGQVTN